MAPTRMQLALKIPPPIVFLLAGALMYGADQALPQLAYAWPGAERAGRALTVCGILLLGIALLGFLHANTSIDPRHPDKARTLVTTGLYRFSRNPMYLGDLLLLLGWGCYLGNLAAWLGVPLFVLYLNRFQIQREEAVLSARFGEAYHDYCRRVRRWL